MKPIDPRLLKYAAVTWQVLSFGSLLALIKTASIIIWTYGVANLIVAVTGSLLKFENETPGEALTGLHERFDTTSWVLIAAVALAFRAIAGWGIDVLAARGGVKAKTQLRQLALANLERLGPSWVAHKSGVDLTVRLTRGLDALDKYFGQFVPQLILAIVTTPVLVLVLLRADFLSGVIVVIVFPLMPIFMFLIGFATQGAQDKQWQALQSLSAAYMSVLGGIETLKIFRLEKRQVRRVAEITENYRARTMKVLRMTFISGFVLDLGATLSVALVAVTIGTRLVEGSFPLITGLFILLLLPETFIAVRNVGAAFHASGEGISAANDVFEIIEAQPEPTTVIHKISLGKLLGVDNLQIIRQGLPLNMPLSFTLPEGKMIAVTGESGVGKSSIIWAILGFVGARGKVSRTDKFAYVQQQPTVYTGSVLESVAFNDTNPDEVLVSELLTELGLRFELQSDATRVSGGQAQRIAIARALYFAQKTGAKLLLLDEPTSQVDTETEQLIYRALRERAELGYGVLFITHSSWLAAQADSVVQVSAAQEVTKT